MPNSFEGKLHAFRRTQDGVVISYVVHPNDVSAEMATASLGTRYMIAFSEIGDNEKELVPDGPNSSVPGSPIAKAEVRDKPSRKFAEMPLSQQAALRCNDKQFQECFFAADAIGAAHKVRFVCNVKSRSELDNPDCIGRVMWEKMEADYQAYLTDKRYGGPRYTGRELE